MKNKDGAQNLLVCSLRPDIQIQTIHTQTVPQEKFVPDELMAITNNQAGKAKSGIVRIKKTKAKQKSKVRPLLWLLYVIVAVGCWSAMGSGKF